MKTTTQTFSVNQCVAGLAVRPTCARLPVRLSCSAPSPTAALAAIRRRAKPLATCGATLEWDGYGGTTEKLGGKGLLGQGVRYRATASATLKLSFAEADDWLARTAALESLRERVSSHEGDECRIGAAVYLVEDLEQHRPALLEAIRAKVQPAADAFGLRVAELELPVELSVTVSGPAHARVHTEARVRLAA
ncbi:MAG: hypothetical protein KDA24_13905 [Deltaproteobacteria bacterium]|nr:hypothetical protein [Deltaproteobacteria bacterium]